MHSTGMYEALPQCCRTTNYPRRMGVLPDGLGEYYSPNPFILGKAKEKALD